MVIPFTCNLILTIGPAVVPAVSSEEVAEVPTEELIENLAECEKVEYELRDRVPGVCYKVDRRVGLQ